MHRPDVTGFFDQTTNTISYVVADPETSRCAIIDSVLDYQAASGRTKTVSADRLIDHVRQKDYVLDWIIDTHVHADHLTAAPYIKQQLGGRVAIGAGIAAVQRTFGPIFNAGTDFARDGRQFDHLFTDDECYQLGTINARAMHTPGHTPACMSHVIGDAVFVGDTIFMPDFGTARCDFPGGDAGVLYDSIQKLFALDDATRMFLCHDYKAPPARTEFAWETTVGAQKQFNIHVKAGTTREAFIKMRRERDATLSMPTLILPSVQVNMRAGALPPAEDNGHHYIKVPVNLV